MNSISGLSTDCLALLQRHNLLRSLAERQVIAAAVEGIVLSADEKSQARSVFQQQRQLSNEEALQAFASRFGLGAADLEGLIEQPIKIEKHCSEHFSSKAEAHFLSRKDSLDRVVYSLLRVKELPLARELYFRIAAGEGNFADLAATYAEGPEKNTKGIVGPVPITNAHPHLAERLRTSSPGKLLEPFRIESWWLVARLESYTPASFDNATARQMSRELFDRWVNEEVDSWIQTIQPATSKLDLPSPSGHNDESLHPNSGSEDPESRAQ